MCVQYIGGCSVHRGVFSTSGGYHEYIGEDTMSTSGRYHEYIGEISWVHRGMFSTSGRYHDERGGYHEYIGGCSVHLRDTMSTSGGYHEYIGGCSVHRRDIMIHVGEQLDKIFSISIENSNVLNIPRCTEHPPMYWTSPDVLMISPWCTHGIPPMYSWYLPDVLNTPRCTEHPPDVLNTHYTGWLTASHRNGVINTEKMTRLSFEKCHISAIFFRHVGMTFLYDDKKFFRAMLCQEIFCPHAPQKNFVKLADLLEWLKLHFLTTTRP